MTHEPIWRRYARLHGPDPRRDLDDELAFHLEERVEALVARGLTPETARAQALAKLGDVERARATILRIGARRTSRTRWRTRLESVGQDVRFALRAIRRAPVVFAAAVATAALGIGANVVVFSILNALLLRPLPVPHAERLVRLYTSERAAAGDPRDWLGASSWPDARDFGRAPSLASVAAYTPLAANVRRGTDLARAEAWLVSDEFFATLGVRAALGRVIARGDARDPSGAPIAVLAHHYWTSAFGGDTAVVGARVWINGRSVTIGGVAPASFTGIDASKVDLYLPLGAQRELAAGVDLLHDRGDRVFRVVGRLAPGASPEGAERELRGIMRQLGEDHPRSNAERLVTVRPARSVVAREVAGDSLAPVAVLVFGTTGVVLLIAAVNVAGLLLARATVRRRELAVRLSIGAGRARLLRQLVTEGLVLAVIAELIALAAVAALPLVARALGVPPGIDFAPDGRVLAFASAVALGAGILFGLVPALHGLSNLSLALRDGDSSAGSGGTARGRPSRARLHRTLVVAQVALSSLLLVVGGLLASSLRRQHAVRPGFEHTRLVAAEFEGTGGSQTPEQERAFAAAMLARVRALPGVTSAAVAANPPMVGDGMRTWVGVPGYQAAPDEEMEVPFMTAGPDYFRTLGVRLVRGAELSSGALAAGDSLPSVVVNEAMARRYWNGRDPVGTLVRLGGPSGRAVRVIGVSADARLHSLAEPPRPRFVVQHPQGRGAALLVRTSTRAAESIGALRSPLQASAGGFVLRRLRTMEQVLGSSLAEARAVTSTIGVLAALALVLAVTGLYGVVSYLVALRTREFGIRMALGAAPGDVLRLVLRLGLQLVLVGGAVGLLAGAGGARLLRGMIYAASATELPTLAAVAALMAGVGVVACLVPALRATRTPPSTSLRVD